MQHMTALTQIQTQPPRAHGTLAITAKSLGNGMSGLERLHQSGSAKLLPIPARGAVEAVIVNTAGGLTGGDTLSLTAHVRPGAHMRLTTQAAERIYRSADQSAGRVQTSLTVDADARMDWLPQETILFDGGHLRRKLSVALAPGARALIVEPVLFGRLSMGETVQDAQLHDRIEITRDGAPLVTEATSLTGNIADRLDRIAIGSEARAMALVYYVAPEACAHLDAIREALPPIAGASMLRPDILSVRCLATDGFELRKALLPVLDRLSDNALPRCWRL